MITRERLPFFGPRRLRWRSVRLRDAVLLTLPVWLALAFVWGGAYLRFLEVQRFDDWWSHQSRLRRLVQARVDTLRALPEAMAIRLRLDAESPDPAVVRLLLDRGDFAAWHGDPLALRDVWLEAELVQGNDYHEVEIRKRGDTSVHWATPKKSMTVKTKRGSLYKGWRRFVLSAKSPLEQVLTNALAADYGALAPHTTLGPVFVNDRFQGVYRIVENVDEGFLRAHGHMPGNVFRGDTAERGEAYPGRPRGLFENLFIWDRVARNDRPTAPERSALAALLRAVQGASFAEHQQLLRLVDLPEWSPIFAAMLVAGDPYHQTNVHNHYWYEDPSSARLHLVVVDVRLRDLEEPPVLGLNEAFRALLRDPRVLDGALAELARRDAEGSLLGRTRERLADLEARFGDALRFDRLRRGEIPPVARGEDLVAGLEANAATLRGWIADARAEALVTPPGAAQPGIVDVVVAGHAAVELTGLALGEGRLPRIHADRDRDGRLGPGDPALALVREADGSARLAEPLRLLPGVDTASGAIAPAPLAYRLLLAPEPGAAPVRGLRLRNAHTGAAVAATPLAPGTPLDEGPSWHPWRFEEPAPRTRRLSGTVELRETLHVPAHETLVIAPGTTLRLAPDVSILSYGRVRAEGRAGSPIRIVPLEAGRPWGALALQGEGASGSRFAHVEIEGGSCAVLDGVEYKGMVDVHHARDVRFTRARFADNLRCDDAINAVHAEVDLRGVRFVRANADAADYDYSWGLVCGSSFEGSGNDGIDLMTSTPWIQDNTIRGSGDKGISIGEESRPTAVGNRIEDCEIGIEVKDGSEPWLVGTQLAGNATGVNQKKKNWRYGEGGFARWVGPPLDGAVSDPFSRLAVAPGGSGDDARWALAPVREAIRFRDDWTPPQDGFVAVSGRPRLERRRGDLVAALRPHETVLERPLDWDLGGADGGSRLVVEAASVALGSLQLELEAADGTWFRAPLPVSGAADRYALAVLAPPPARYVRLRLVARPEARGARLHLHEVRWAVPAEAPDPTCLPPEVATAR